MSPKKKIVPLLSHVVILLVIQRSRRTSTTPCTEQFVDDECVTDVECQGWGSVCRSGRCACFPDLEIYNQSLAGREDHRSQSTNPNDHLQLTATSPKSFCVPAPAEIGANCTSICASPLICQEGKCACWQGVVDPNGKCRVDCPLGFDLIRGSCVRVSRLMESCNRTGQCIDPMTQCVAGMCDCVPGTENKAGVCTPVCPDGQTATIPCTRYLMSDSDVLDHSGKQDSCPVGYACMTYGKPFRGHCCRLGCPYGTPDLSRSCAANAPNPCRRLTHFCQPFESPGWKSTVCCPRPCREPRPYLIGGECHSIGHRGDLCISDEQCEGGRTMKCEDRKCVCRQGFIPISSDYFPTCLRACALNQVSIGTGCLDRVTLGQPCLLNAQCGKNARCYMGKCSCECGRVPGGLLKDDCVEPLDPFNLKSVFQSVGNFLINPLQSAASATGPLPIIGYDPLSSTDPFRRRVVS